MKVWKYNAMGNIIGHLIFTVPLLGLLGTWIYCEPMLWLGVAVVAWFFCAAGWVIVKLERG